MVTLTPRQRQVLAMVAEGCGDAAIAEKLDISPRTVKSHIVNARYKLNAINRAHAVALALQQQMLVPTENR